MCMVSDHTSRSKTKTTVLGHCTHNFTSLAGADHYTVLGTQTVTQLYTGTTLTTAEAG